MTDASTAARRAEALLSGPRGRRMLLDFARASEAPTADGWLGAFGLAVNHAAHHLDPHRGSSTLVMIGGDPGAVPDVPRVSPREVADALAALDLAAPTMPRLRQSLQAAADAARYWQEPDGDDVLAATPEMRDALARVAAHVAQSPECAWWWSPLAADQWTVEWVDDMPRGPLHHDPRERLRERRAQELEEEAQAQCERPADPTARWSGNWWSTPNWGIPTSTRAYADDAPVALWAWEDAMGWDAAHAFRVQTPADARVFEIDSAEAWADLCARFPFEATGQKRHDWFRATGRDGAWVVPDWVRVAERYDAVHLPVATYLAAAGTAIAVDETRASVIAGWHPDETCWFVPGVRRVGDPVGWVLREREQEYVWERDASLERP